MCMCVCVHVYVWGYIQVCVVGRGGVIHLCGRGQELYTCVYEGVRLYTCVTWGVCICV